MPPFVPKISYDLTNLRGGLDQITPTLSLPPGYARDAVNFECAPLGGYTRIGGYERYSGLTKPSDASFTILQVASFTNVPTLGQTLTGFTSGATGVIIAITPTYMALTKIAVSTFTTSEVVKVGGTTIGTAVPTTASISARQRAVYLAAAADVYRALISAVPGEGSILGVATLTVGGSDKVYAFRNNVGSTSADLYVDSGSGWSKINYKHEVSFTAGGAVTPADGATLTQGANTATVRRVMDSSGSWAGSTAAGRFVIDAPAPGNFIAGAATLSGGATVTLSGANAAITMSPSGRFEFATGNFSGSSTTLRLYGCDGVNRGFEFDGTTLAPIATGASSDTPKHVAAHKNALMFTIGTNLIFSGPGTPFRYLAADSGGSIAVGDSITGLLAQPGAQTTAALAVYATSNTFMLYGTGLATWNLVTYNTGAGGKRYTAQNLSQSYVLDTLGVLALSTTLAFGNFEQSTVTRNLQPFVLGRLSSALSSSVSREKSQYRVFFSDGYGLYITVVNNKNLGSMPVYFPDPVKCICTGTNASGNEVSYFGSSSGYVFQLDKGSSFDGASIDARITLGWNAVRSPRVTKRWRHASMEIQGSYYAEFGFGYLLGYGTGDRAQTLSTTYASSFVAPSDWDTFIWDAFTWDGTTASPTELEVRGSSVNMQVALTSTGNFIYPFTLNSLILHYTPLRGIR